jgi:glyoxylase-like metal-dependent hydrolase (beta-lactamase superfamily II)
LQPEKYVCELLKWTTKDRFAGTRPTPASRSFRSRERIEMGGEAIELIFAGGGHTPGDSIVWLPKQRVAFSGMENYQELRGGNANRAYLEAEVE